MVCEQIIGIDFGRVELVRLEHELTTRVGRAAIEIATHVVRGQYVGSVRSSVLNLGDIARLFPEADIALATTDPDADAVSHVEERVSRAECAADAHAARMSGRLIWFAGDGRLASVASVGHIVDRTDIERVVALGAEIDDFDLVALNGFVRPVFQNGQVVLHVTTGAENVFRTFETANPHQCCGGAH
jgi:hypothetical protein